MSRLSDCLGAPDGITAETALARADEELQAMAPQALEQMSVCLASLQNQIEQWRSGVLSELLLRVTALELYAVAGAFGRPHLAAAAKLIAETVEQLARAGRLSGDVLVTFSASLHSLFREESADDQTAQELVSQLHVLTRRALAAEAPP